MMRIIITMNLLAGKNNSEDLPEEAKLSGSTYVLDKYFFEHKIVNIFLLVSFNMCFEPVLLNQFF